MATSLSSAKLDLAMALSYIDTGLQNTIDDALKAGNNSFSSFLKTLQNGTTANKANVIWHDRRTVAAATNDDLDLTTLTDRLGNALAFTLIKWFVLRLITPTTGYKLTVGNGAANQFTGWFGAAAHTEDVMDWMAKVNQIDGWTVDGTHKSLRIRNPGANPITYDIVLVGTK